MWVKLTLHTAAHFVGRALLQSAPHNLGGGSLHKVKRSLQAGPSLQTTTLFARVVHSAEYRAFYRRGFLYEVHCWGYFWPHPRQNLRIQNPPPLVKGTFSVLQAVARRTSGDSTGPALSTPLLQNVGGTTLQDTARHVCGGHSRKYNTLCRQTN